MKYVALLSGGKDSCYNLLHCRQNGHQLVAAASLGPEHGKEELDSYLYQTVGQDAIQFVATALDVPLFRRVITGSAVERGSEYGGRDAQNRAGIVGDETEDLYALLYDVKSQFPGMQGVSVGAILSSYQRVRVEHVCRRLGLIPLCYLWQRDQAELLSEMIEAGMDAILIKVAGIGLTTKHLGKTLAEMQPTLTKLNELYGSHVCGEGGEYESLTLDCSLFKKRITLIDTEVVIHSDNDFATVAFLRIKNALLEEKPDNHIATVAMPALLDDEYSAIMDAIPASSSEPHESQVTTHTISLHAGPTEQKRGKWIAFGDIQRKLTDVAMTLEEEVVECFHIVQERLKEHSLRLSNLTNVNIFISSMDLFASVNAVYASFFGSSPPARACVAADLHSPYRVRLDCIAFDEPSPRDRLALHVQGLSYWAPANIGPYSQAIIADERIFISGQIGMIPSSLALPLPVSLGLETALASQHVDRVVKTLQSGPGGGWHGFSQLNIFWHARAHDISFVRKACASVLSDAPTLFVVVKELPKCALVEKQVLYHTGRAFIVDEDGESNVISQRPLLHNGDLKDENIKMHWESSQFEGTASATAIFCGKGRGDRSTLLRQLKNVKPLRDILDLALSVRLFYTSSETSSSTALLHELLFTDTLSALTHVPCRTISTQNEDDWDYALCIVCN